MRRLLFAIALLLSIPAYSQLGIATEIVGRKYYGSTQLYGDTIWAINGPITFGIAHDLNLYRSSSTVLRTDDYFRAVRIGIGADPTTIFYAAGTDAGDYATYDGSGLEIRLTTVPPAPEPWLEVYDDNGVAMFSGIIDELGNGGIAGRNDAGLEIWKLNGYLNGHSFFNQEYFSIGRNGVVSAYGGTLAGGMLTVNNSRFDRDPAADLNNPNEYMIVVEDEDNDGDWLGVGFISGGTGTYEDNIGAALIYENTGSAGQGVLHGYAKSSTTDAADPDLIFTAGNEVFALDYIPSVTEDNSDSIATFDAYGRIGWKTFIGQSILQGVPDVTVAAGYTVYTVFNQTSTAVEIRRQLIIPIDGTIKKLYVTTSSAQPGTGTATATIRINGVSSSVVATIGSGASAGTFTDLSNTVSVSAGDLVSIKLTNNAATTSARIISVACVLEY